MRFLSTLLLLAIATLGLSVVESAQATPAREDAAWIVVAQRNCASLDQAVEQVRRQYGGRIVSAETRRSGNREVHHIKVLTPDGKVKSVQVQGCSASRG